MAQVGSCLPIYPYPARGVTIWYMYCLRGAFDFLFFFLRAVQMWTHRAGSCSEKAQSSGEKVNLEGCE